MDQVLQVLKSIVSSFSEFGSIPKPIRVCVALFSGVFGFCLIFVYARLDKKQAILLAGLIVLMALITGAYYLWKSRSSAEQQADSVPTSAPAQAPLGSANRERPAPAFAGSGDTTNFWGTPPARPVQRAEPRPERMQPVSHAELPRMTLLELVEPIFQYVCRLNRIARRGPGARTGETTFLSKAAAASAGAAARGGTLDEVVVRSEIKALLEDMMSKAASDLRLSQQASKIELPLIFFIDSMISESALPFAAQWNQNRLAYDRQELAGDEKFFDLLDETSKENGEDAAERLAVFYTCIGLGFTGIYFKQPELLRKTMLGIAPRIRHLVENDASARVCPEAYQYLDTRNLVEPPSSRMVVVGLLFACFTLAVLITYGFMYREASRNINDALEQVLHQDLATASQH